MVTETTINERKICRARKLNWCLQKKPGQKFSWAFCEVAIGKIFYVWWNYGCQNEFWWSFHVTAYWASVFKALTVIIIYPREPSIYSPPCCLGRILRVLSSNSHYLYTSLPNIVGRQKHLREYHMFIRAVEYSAIFSDIDYSKQLIHSHASPSIIPRWIDLKLARGAVRIQSTMLSR